MIVTKMLGEVRREKWKFDIESVWPSYLPVIRLQEYYWEEFNGELWIVDDNVFWEADNENESTIEAPEISKEVLDLMKAEIRSDWFNREFEVEYGI